MRRRVNRLILLRNDFLCCFSVRRGSGLNSVGTTFRLRSSALTLVGLYSGTIKSPRHIGRHLSARSFPPMNSRRPRLDDSCLISIAERRPFSSGKRKVRLGRISFILRSTKHFTKWRSSKCQISEGDTITPKAKKLAISVLSSLGPWQTHMTLRRAVQSVGRLIGGDSC